MENISSVSGRCFRNCSVCFQILSKIQTLLASYKEKSSLNTKSYDYEVVFFGIFLVPGWGISGMNLVQMCCWDFLNPPYKCILGHEKRTQSIKFKVHVQYNHHQG